MVAIILSLIHILQTSDTEELYKGRDSRDFVLGKVIEDLEFAIQWLPHYGIFCMCRNTDIHVLIEYELHL